MSWIKITERVQSSVPSLLFKLIHGGEVTIGGRAFRIDNPVLPVVERKDDYLLWTFSEPLRVSTPGPDGRINEIKQYADKITISVFPWAFVTILISDK